MVPRGKGSHLQGEGIMEKSSTIQSQQKVVVGFRTVCNSSLFQVLPLWITDVRVPWRPGVHKTWQCCASKTLGMSEPALTLLRQHKTKGEGPLNNVDILGPRSSTAVWEDAWQDITAALTWSRSVYKYTRDSWKTQCPVRQSPVGNELFLLTSPCYLPKLWRAGEVWLLSRIPLCPPWFWSFLQLALWLACGYIQNS